MCVYIEVLCVETTDVHTSIAIEQDTKYYGMWTLMFLLLLISENMGKTAPSVFSGLRTGAETALDKPKAPSGSVFGN